MEPKKINIVFMGTTDFSAAILKKILDMKEFNVVGVVCQPDRKVGRKQIIIPSLVKLLAQENNLLVWQPEKIGDLYLELNSLNLDLILTCAYGQFLPEKILTVAKKNLNIHASLLPDLRGGAPIQWAIINGFKKTGISFITMVKKMDAGSIFVKEAVLISKDETYSSLKIKLINLAISMLKKYLLDICSNKILPVPQDESQATLGLNITRADELINWDQNSQKISCHVRALYDNPIAYSILNNNIYKIHKVLISNQVSLSTPGTITNINKLGVFVATKDYDVVITEIQPAGKKVISASNYFGSKDFPIKINMIFMKG